MAKRGGISGIAGEPIAFEYWSLGKSDKSETGFGYVDTPVKTGKKRTGLALEEYLPQTEFFLQDAIARWLTGDEPFTARLNPDLAVYSDYDQLMRLDEWQARAAREEVP
jgi:ATP-dependent helicase/nuclease subunit B